MRCRVARSFNGWIARKHMWGVVWQRSVQRLQSTTPHDHLRLRDHCNPPVERPCNTCNTSHMLRGESTVSVNRILALSSFALKMAHATYTWGVDLLLWKASQDSYNQRCTLYAWTKNWNLCKQTCYFFVVSGKFLPLIPLTFQTAGSKKTCAISKNWSQRLNQIMLTDYLETFLE